VTIRRLLLVFLLFVLIVLIKPKTVWSEFKRIRGQWNTILTLLVIVVAAYFIFGLWRAYFNGGFP
jgi:glycopeptide antibiotics resistance protein